MYFIAGYVSMYDENSETSHSLSSIGNNHDVNLSALSENLDSRLFFLEENDQGNAQRLIERYGADLMYVPTKDWFVWDGRCWVPDMEAQSVNRMAHKVAAHIKTEAEAIDIGLLIRKFVEQDGLSEKKARKEASVAIKRHKKWGIISGNQAKISPMIKASQPYLTTRISNLNEDNYLLCVENGTLELHVREMERNGYVRIKAHSREDRITCLANAKFDPEATCPTWENFLIQILPDEETRLFVQRFMGYMITGDISEQCLCVFYGDGANGKSTMMEVLAAVMGDYAKSLPISSLLHTDRKGGGDATPDLARLPWARYLRTSEPEAGSKLSVSLIKQMTGGEQMTVRALHKDFIEFMPQFKIVLAFNNKPNITGGDHGTWRRIKMVPFTMQIAEQDKDPHLKEKLLEERSGILNWLLDGYRMWQDQKGLNTPASVLEATDEYRDEQNHITVYIRDRVTRSEGQRIQASKLYNDYCEWCQNNGIKEYTQSLFGRIVVERGLKKFKQGVLYYTNVGFVD